MYHTGQLYGPGAWHKTLGSGQKHMKCNPCRVQWLVCGCCCICQYTCQSAARRYVLQMHPPNDQHFSALMMPILVLPTSHLKSNIGHIWTSKVIGQTRWLEWSSCFAALVPALQNLFDKAFAAAKKELAQCGYWPLVSIDSNPLVTWCKRDILLVASSHLDSTMTS